jgi:hypothetical protein
MGGGNKFVTLVQLEFEGEFLWRKENWRTWRKFLKRRLDSNILNKNMPPSLRIKPEPVARSNIRKHKLPL